MATEKPPDIESDKSLMCRIADSKDERALGLLMAQYAPKAMGYLKKHFGKQLRDPEIDQAVNDAAYNVWRFASKFDPSKSFGSWFIRIVQRAALSIIRGEKAHVAKELEYDPSYDPATDGGDEAPECPKEEMTRVAMLEDIIENELTGFEQILARADVAAGGTADTVRLACENGKSKAVVYTTRSKVREKIRTKILQREARKDSAKGKK